MGAPLTGIELANVSVVRGGAAVVRRFSATFPAGRWTGLIGANGSGKTSLLRAMAGRLDFAGGSILMGSKERVQDRPWRAKSCGYAPDISTLPETLTGSEFLSLAKREESPNDRMALIEPLAAALSFEGFAGRRISTMSAGMRQRIAIYSAFVNGQDTVLLDEPFNWLDPVTAFETKAALRTLVDQGLTLICALHDLSTLTLCCDEGILMLEGEMRRHISNQELRRGSADVSGFERMMVEHLRATGSAVIG